MVPQNTRTLIIKSAFPAGLSHAGIADTIAKSLSGKIDSFQVFPGGIIRISFLDSHTKKTYEEAGSICFNNVSCQVVCSTLFVVIGTNIVHMVRQHDIPRNTVIVKCRMWYKGQPLVWDICSNNHKVADCPLCGKCRRCHESSHFVHDCPKPVWYMPGREDDPSSAPSVTPPLVGASASMEEPVNDTHVEYDAGKEVPPCQVSQSDLSGGGGGWALTPWWRMFLPPPMSLRRRPEGHGS